MVRKIVILTLICFSLLTCAAYAAVGQQDAEVPQDAMSGDVLDAATAQQDSDNSVPLDEYKKFIEREIDQQRQLINIFIVIISIIIGILAIFVAIFTIIYNSKISQIERLAERELKRVEEIRKKAKKIVEEDMQLEFENLKKVIEIEIANVKKYVSVFQQIKEKKPDEKLTPFFKKEIEDVVEDIDKIPTDRRTAYDYFIMAFEEENLEDKIRLYSKAIELNPDYSEAYNNRGVAYRKKGEYDRAILDFDKAIELNPDGVLAYFNKACALAMKGKKEEALDNLEIAANKGYKDIKLARTARDLDSLRDDPQFEVIMKKIEENVKGK